MTDVVRHLRGASLVLPPGWELGTGGPDQGTGVPAAQASDAGGSSAASRASSAVGLSRKWDARFLKLAETIGSFSRDPSTKVGAVIVRWDKTVLSMGFNGFPRGFDDHPHRYNDRATKYRYVVHAELNAILTAREPLHGAFLYVHPFPPCGECAKAIAQSGIRKVISRWPTNEQYARWRDSFDASEQILRECGIEWIYYMPDEVIDPDGGLV